MAPSIPKPLYLTLVLSFVGERGLMTSSIPKPLYLALVLSFVGERGLMAPSIPKPLYLALVLSFSRRSFGRPAGRPCLGPLTEGEGIFCGRRGWGARLGKDPLISRSPERCGQRFRGRLPGLLQGPVLQDPVELDLILTIFDLGRAIHKKFSCARGRFRPEILSRLSMGHRDAHDDVHAAFTGLAGRKRE